MFSKKEYYSLSYGIVFQYLIISLFIRPYYRLFFGMKTVGVENTPHNQSVIFAATHSSHHDPTILSASVKNSIAYMAKKELFEVPVLSQIITALGAFSVNRQKLEISTIKIAKHILSTKKWNLGIFPQGTRIKDGSFDSVKPGFSHLAKATKVPVVPVFIDLKPGKYPFYGNLTVKIGKPLPESSDPEEITENWKAAIEKLRAGD